MQSSLKIGLDIDDTLLGFWETYLEIFGTPKNNYEITKNVNKLQKNKLFWESLPKLREIDFEPTLYCTKRINSKVYTRNSLAKNGFPIKPIYQVVYQKGNKANFIKGKVDVFIDDSINNFEDLNAAGILCLLIDSENNQKYKTHLRIYDLNFDTILTKYNQWKNI